MDGCPKVDHSSNISPGLRRTALQLPVSNAFHPSKQLKQLGISYARSYMIHPCEEAGRCAWTIATSAQALQIANDEPMNWSRHRRSERQDLRRRPSSPFLQLVGHSRCNNGPKCANTLTYLWRTDHKLLKSNCTLLEAKNLHRIVHRQRGGKINNFMCERLSFDHGQACGHCCCYCWCYSIEEQSHEQVAEGSVSGSYLVSYGKQTIRQPITETIFDNL